MHTYIVGLCNTLDNKFIIVIKKFYYRNNSKFPDTIVYYTNTLVHRVILELKYMRNTII